MHSHLIPPVPEADPEEGRERIATIIPPVLEAVPVQVPIVE